MFAAVPLCIGNQIPVICRLSPVARALCRAVWPEGSVVDFSSDASLTRRPEVHDRIIAARANALVNPAAYMVAGAAGRDRERGFVGNGDDPATPTETCDTIGGTRIRHSVNHVYAGGKEILPAAARFDKTATSRNRRKVAEGE